MNNKTILIPGEGIGLQSANIVEELPNFLLLRIVYKPSIGAPRIVAAVSAFAPFGSANPDELGDRGAGACTCAVLLGRVVAPAGRAAAGPPSERSRECACRRIAEAFGNFGDGQPGVGQEFARKLEPDFVEYPLKRRSFGLEPAVERPATQVQSPGNVVAGRDAPSDAGPKNLAKRGPGAALAVGGWNGGVH